MEEIQAQLKSTKEEMMAVPEHLPDDIMGRHVRRILDMSTQLGTTKSGVVKQAFDLMMPLLLASGMTPLGTPASSPGASQGAPAFNF
eukprot:5382988-Karenia_brevis.AAC.1